MSTWLMALARKLIIDLVQLVILKLSAYFKKIKRDKKQDETLKKYEDSVATNKPHEEKVKDAENLLNSGKP